LCLLEENRRIRTLFQILLPLIRAGEFFFVCKIRSTLVNVMNIRGMRTFSMIDFPGKLSCVVFAGNCNFKCAYCHNPSLVFDPESQPEITEKQFLAFLDKRVGRLDGVVISGGEPSLRRGLVSFAKKIKAKGFLIKLDTNGSSPEVLARLLAGKLADYVAMDVKGPRALWRSITGQGESGDAMIESMRLVARFPRYEFRTTAGPVLRGGGDITFLTAAEIAETAKLILETTGGAGHRYFIQKFVPRKDGLLDSRLEKFPETPGELLEEMRKAAAVYLPGTEIRG